MEQTAQGFTVTVTAALSGKLLCALTSQHAGLLYVRYLKLAIQKRPGLPSPFTVCLLKGADTPDEFCHLQEITDTDELHLEFLLQKRSRPAACQQVALAEAIGHQLPLEVWRILSHGLLLTGCLPTNGLMTVNPLVLSIQSTSLAQQKPPSTGRPCILESLLQANCDPNHFGHPPKSPLIEAALRNDLPTIQLLVVWRADVNLQARGSPLPLVFAVKQQRLDMVKCLLDLRANPTVSCYSPLRDHPRARWTRITVKQLTTPDTDIAQLIDQSIKEWTAFASSDNTCVVEFTSSNSNMHPRP